MIDEKYYVDKPKDTYWANGNPQYQYKFEGDIVTQYRSYYESGQIRNEEFYQEEGIHGLCRYWDESGQLILEESYLNGDAHGIQKRWDECGHLEHVRYYLYDQPVSEEEYRKHQLIEKLSGLEDESHIR